MKILLVCLVAAFAMSAVAASAASAETEAEQQFFQNAAKEAPKKANFKDKSGLSILVVSGTVVQCKKDTSFGHFVGRTKIVDVVIYENCKVIAGGKECEINSVGAKAAGEITTTELTGELGEITTGSKVGILLEGEVNKAKEKVFATLAATECSPETKVTGTIIGEVENKKKLSSTGNVILTTAKKEGKTQSITKIERSSNDESVTAGLKAFGKAATDETTEENEFEEELELNAGA